MKYVDIREGAKDEDLFWEILYDENLAKGRFCFSERLVRETGGINHELKAKSIYELLLRAADGRAVLIEERDDESAPGGREWRSCLVAEDLQDEDAWEGMRTDCYLVGRYRDKLLAERCFDEIVESILLTADRQGVKGEAIALLEDMIQRGEPYYRIADDTEPVLIYKGDGVCHDILNVFAEQFGEALERRHQRVEYFNPDEEGFSKVARMMGRHFKAVVGFQAYLFDAKTQDGRYAHDEIHAPKFNFIFDHPIWMKVHLQQNARNLCYLTHDSNYVDFIREYYGKKAVLFPPAATAPPRDGVERIYDVSFVGTCGDYWQEVLIIHQMDREMRFLANWFLLKMRKNPNIPAEQALKEVLEERGCHCTREEFLEIFHQLRRVIYCVMHYFRQKVIRTLLESGLCIDAFGDSWAASPLSRHPNLICHPDISAEESVRVYQQSKCSLNIMAWHKGGFTERMAGIMLCGAVLITDQTSYLKDAFDTEHDMIAFDLEEVGQLSERIRACLGHPEMMAEMAHRGQKKAMEGHTWDKRAEQFLDEVLKSEYVRESNA